MTITGAARRPRLSEAALARVRPDLLIPYDRRVAARMVHLGVGAFARAHLGVYADDLLRAGWAATVHGISLRSAEPEQKLRPQDGLYTVEEGAELRLIGSFARVSTGARAAVEAIAQPEVQMVTLTITEKGYETGPGGRPPPAAAVLAEGLAHRRGVGGGPPVVVSLDNVADNGKVLRERVLAAAGELDSAIAAWIADRVTFPSSVVDRMVPAPNDQVLGRIGRALGLEDRAAVATEPYRSWVIEQTEGLPPLDRVGVEVVGDVAPFERRKLWLLNGPHSAAAYAGLVAGCTTIAEAVGHPVVGPLVRRLVAETIEVCDLAESLAPARFAEQAQRRFANAGLGHTCRQVGEDGSRKLAQRLQPVVAARRSRGRPTAGFALVVAAWIAAVAGVAVKGTTLPSPGDPSADELRAVEVGGAGRRTLVNGAIGSWGDGEFVDEVVAALHSLERSGTLAFMEGA